MTADYSGFFRPCWLIYKISTSIIDKSQHLMTVLQYQCLTCKSRHLRYFMKFVALLFVASLLVLVLQCTTASATPIPTTAPPPPHVTIRFYVGGYDIIDETNIKTILVSSLTNISTSSNSSSIISFVIHSQCIISSADTIDDDESQTDTRDGICCSAIQDTTFNILSTMKLHVQREEKEDEDDEQQQQKKQYDSNNNYQYLLNRIINNQLIYQSIINHVNKESCTNNIIASVYDDDIDLLLQQSALRKSSSELQHSNSVTHLYSMVYSHRVPIISADDTAFIPTSFTSQSNSTNSTGVTSNTILPPSIYTMKRTFTKRYDNYNTNTTTGSKEPPQQLQVDKPILLYTKLNTSLSVSSGMHRDLHHTIQLEYYDRNHGITNDAVPVVMPSSQEYNITLYVMFHLPSNLFINIEDCFDYTVSTLIQTNHKSFVATIQSIDIVPSSSSSFLNTRSTGNVIDQEEPEFVSPEHIVLYQIQLLLHIPPSPSLSTTEKLNDMTNRNIHYVTSIDFNTKLHLRYPKPFGINNNDHHHVNYRHIMIAPPVLLSGFIQSSNHKDKIDSMNDDHNIQLVLFDTGDDKTSAQDQQSLLQLWVAPGHQNHFISTVTITIIVAIIGSIIMLWDISNVSSSFIHLR